MSAKLLLRQREEQVAKALFSGVIVKVLIVTAGLTDHYSAQRSACSSVATYNLCTSFLMPPFLRIQFRHDHCRNFSTLLPSPLPFTAQSTLGELSTSFSAKEGEKFHFAKNKLLLSNGAHYHWHKNTDESDFSFKNSPCHVCLLFLPL